jgi:hypothetical protein
MSANFEMNRIYFERQKFIVLMINYETLEKEWGTAAFYVREKTTNLYE